MRNNNIKMALASLKSSKWRSLLTMLGIIIGVASVLITISLGEGVRQQITSQINHLGEDLITVRPGKTVTRNSEGNITGFNMLNVLGSAGHLTEQDIKTVRDLPGTGISVPMNLVSGTLSIDERDYDGGFVIGVTPGAPDVLNQKLGYGSFFESDDAGNVAVIGKRVAERLFQENVPIGKSFQFRGERFVVRGVFEEFPTSPLTLTADYNNAVFIPYEKSKEITKNQMLIYQILVKPQNPDNTNQLAQTIQSTLQDSRSGQDDFTILQQEENLAFANYVLTVLTAFVAGVAAISLIVGGIGVMNIMLVSVTERTKEIGVRKAVGATNSQVLSQFLVESAVLSFVGGVIGVLLAILANYLLRMFTELQPIITVPMIVIAVMVSLTVGLFFGVTPALKAARKDPIDALRYE